MLITHKWSGRKNSGKQALMTDQSLQWYLSPQTRWYDWPEPLSQRHSDYSPMPAFYCRRPQWLIPASGLSPDWLHLAFLESIWFISMLVSSAFNQCWSVQLSMLEPFKSWQNHELRHCAEILCFSALSQYFWNTKYLSAVSYSISEIIYFSAVSY